MARDVVEHRADVCDGQALAKLVAELKPDFVFHLAAQPLVRRSYDAPLETFATNVLGTACVLDALRAAGRACVAVVVTSDKCYAPAEVDPRPRAEGDPLGGDDPYSASKACAELVAVAYRRSFFDLCAPASRVRLATVRAGNVIGGGDWSDDRLVADMVRALGAGRPIVLRNPDHVRPWQHVLEPLAGYLSLAACLSSQGGEALCEAWNFGPDPEAWRTVREVCEAAVAAWGSGEIVTAVSDASRPEMSRLTLDIRKASERLGWRPVWTFDRAVRETMAWYATDHRGGDGRALCLAQIDAYERDAAAAGVAWSLR